ncbi:MAG TPA: hypothetical protein VK942_13230, partial [Actinomycetes bacterium]|nr:hypothetical protein [Actinomycetes bacterium]
VPLKTWATNDVPTAADFNSMFSDPLTADVVTLQTTTSLSYTDLATVGPAVTMTMANGQATQVVLSARMKHSAAGGLSSLMSFAVTGATSLSAIDANACECADLSTGGIIVTRATVFIAGATGSHTFTCKYQVQSGGTGTYLLRRIIVKRF